MAETYNITLGVPQVVNEDLAGYLYFCCKDGEFGNVKNGFTKKPDPVQYCHDEYSRTMVPLQILAIVPVADARLMEKISHHMLAPRRLADRHEMFDMSKSKGELDRELLDDVIEMIGKQTRMSGMKLPEAPEVIAERKKLAKIEAMERRRERAAKRKVEREAEAAEEKRLAKQRKIETKRAAEKEKIEKQQVIKGADLAGLQVKLQNFIQDRTTTHRYLHVSSSVFREALQDHWSRLVGASQLKEMMETEGFVTKDRKIRGKNVRSFIGIKLRDGIGHADGAGDSHV